MTGRPLPEALAGEFRPRNALLVAGIVALAVAAGAAFLVVSLPAIAPARSTTGDRWGIVLVAALGVGILARHALVRAVPDAAGLTVHNLLVTRRIVWAQVVSVRFGQGRPWVSLDLADGTTFAVMAIQAADGARAMREARRLATLVEWGTGRSPPSSCSGGHQRPPRVPPGSSPAR